MEVGVQSAERKKQPTRTCVGCRGTNAKHELVRVVLGEDAAVVVDLSGGAFGRGAWLHARPDCIGRAAPRGLSKSFRTTIKTDNAELCAAIAHAAELRFSRRCTTRRCARRLGRPG